MQPTSRRIGALCLVSVLYLSGCASTKPQATKPTTNNNVKPSVLHKQHMAQIADINTFSLKGRLGVIKQPKSFSAKMGWQHTPTKDNIDVYSPLGSKVANISSNAHQVTLTDNKNKTISASSIEALTDKALGFKLPLAGLNDWALGRPSKKSLVNAMTWDANGRVSSLKQSGWDISYADYKPRENYFLPRKVVLKNNSMTLKLIVDQWSESPSAK